MASRIHNHSSRMVATAFFAAVLGHCGAEAASNDSGTAAARMAGLDTSSSAGLSVCIDQSSPAAQMDAHVAAAVGRLHGTNSRISWFNGVGDGDDGYSPRNFATLAGTRCELILGFPVDAQSGQLPDGVYATAPYAQTGFVLVTPSRKKGDHRIETLDTLPSGSTVAVTYLTSPNLFFAAHPQLKAQVFLNDAAAFKALRAHQVAAAALWRPYVAEQLRKAPAAPLDYVAISEPHASWNLVALYAETANASAVQFQQDIETLRRNGTLTQLVKPYADIAPAAAEPAPATSQAERKRPAFAHKDGWQAPAARPLSSFSSGGRLIPVANRSTAKAPVAIYTDAQATAGKAIYDENCLICHGTNLEGRAGPALKGKTFANPKSGLKVGDIFHIVSQNMPAPAPGSLSKEEYVQVMSYILQQNGYPSGAAELTFETAGASKLKLTYTEPTQTANGK